MTFEQTIKTLLEDHFDPQEVAYYLRVFAEDMPALKDRSEEEWESVCSRIVDQEPIQYITGVAPFYGYFFSVNNQVLIPRPETEELVYIINDYIRKTGIGNARILDIGSGTGCIPITLSLLNPNADIQSVDISEGALKVARENNEKLGGKVTFHKVDILDNAEWHQISGTFDIIVSNPPYIPNSEKTLMSANVLDNEPHLALFVEDDDPLIFYDKIHELAKSKLQKDGVIFLECNEFNAQEVKQIYSESYNTEVIKDMQGKERIVIAKRSIRMMK